MKAVKTGLSTPPSLHSSCLLCPPPYYRHHRHTHHVCTQSILSLDNRLSAAVNQRAPVDLWSESSGEKKWFCACGVHGRLTAVKGTEQDKDAWTYRIKNQVKKLLCWTWSAAAAAERDNGSGQRDWTVADVSPWPDLQEEEKTAKEEKRAIVEFGSTTSVCSFFFSFN